MNILVTNDDGVNAPGLWHLAEAMRDLGQVTVVAPDREQSGVGTSISLAKAVRMHKLPYSMEGIETYTVEGTPGDAVIMGAAHLLKGQTIDLVVSGVNHGHNTGAETFLSGTVGAAWHGRQRNIPAIAVSAGYKTPYTGNSLFAVGAGMAAVLAQQIRRGDIPNDVLYNVNVPFCKPEEVRGLILTRSSYGTYADEVREENDGRGAGFLLRGVQAGRGRQTEGHRSLGAGASLPEPDATGQTTLAAAGDAAPQGFCGAGVRSTDATDGAGLADADGRGGWGESGFAQTVVRS